MARQTYRGRFNLNTLQPAVESADPNAVMYKRAGSFGSATQIDVDADDLTKIDPVVSAHDPDVKSQRQSDFDSGVAKLKASGLTDAELQALGLVPVTLV